MFAVSNLPINVILFLVAEDLGYLFHVIYEILTKKIILECEQKEFELHVPHHLCSFYFHT